MALPFAKARSTYAGTSKHYRNLNNARMIVAVNITDATTSNKWFARATDGPSGNDYYILDAAGYATEVACQTAIETALGTPV